jgi:hypothetical protein
MLPDVLQTATIILCKHAINNYNDAIVLASYRSDMKLPQLKRYNVEPYCVHVTSATTLEQVIGTKLPITPVTAMCHDPYKYPELKWKKTAAGKNTATITIAGSSYTNKYGAYTTRSLNGMIPGPLMRMEVS